MEKYDGVKALLSKKCILDRDTDFRVKSLVRFNILAVISAFGLEETFAHILDIMNARNEADISAAKEKLYGSLRKSS